VREFIGVKDIFSSYDTALIKQDALMFDSIAIPAYSKMAPDLRSNDCQVMAELDWLSEEGLIFEPGWIPPTEKVLDNAEYQRYIELEDQCLREMRKLDALSRQTSHPLDANFVLHGFHVQVKRISLLLREVCHLDAYPILSCNCQLTEESKATKKEIVQIALNALPVPDYSTPWEQIMEYRSDPDSKAKFLDLRHWMSEVARAELSPIEVEQKIEYLMSQYQRHMKLHRMKTRVGVLETLVVSSAELFENLIKVKWGSIAKSLFSLKKRQVALMESELTSPGSELAYIVRSAEVFHP
jgi:hypothetical protein